MPATSRAHRSVRRAESLPTPEEVLLFVEDGALATEETILPVKQTRLHSKHFVLQNKANSLRNAEETLPAERLSAARDEKIVRAELFFLQNKTISLEFAQISPTISAITLKI